MKGLPPNCSRIVARASSAADTGILQDADAFREFDGFLDPGQRRQDTREGGGLVRADAPCSQGRQDSRTGLGKVFPRGRTAGASWGRRVGRTRSSRSFAAAVSPDFAARAIAARISGTSLAMASRSLPALVMVPGFLPRGFPLVPGLNCAM